MNPNPIGLFDSGVGGLSICKEIIDLLPHENILYIADNKNAPYGSKRKEEIIHLAQENTLKLISKNCKIIVVACNTATTNAIEYLRSNFNIPFIGIEPAIKPASLDTITGVVGVLATRGTISSSLFKKTSGSYGAGIKIVTQNGDGLVELMEQGHFEDEKIKLLLDKYLDVMTSQNIDRLVLGCTHYPLLRPIIEGLISKDIKIIDSGEAVAKQTLKVMKDNNLLGESKNPTYEFFASGQVSTLNIFLEKVFPNRNFAGKSYF